MDEVNTIFCKEYKLDNFYVTGILPVIGRKCVG